MISMTRSDRHAAMAVGAVGVAASAAALPTVCPFRICTGHACPMCGMTRAAGSSLSGDLTAAVQYHPMMVVLALQLLATGAYFLATDRTPSRTTVRALAVANAIGFFAVWVGRWRLGLLDFVVAT